MATVHLGRTVGSAGFSRLVAIKRLHPELAAEREFVAMLIDEARLAAQIRHTNVVGTLDLVVSDGAFSLVLEYIEGDSLAALLRRVREREEAVPAPIALALIYGVLRGLDAAHDTRNEEGQPLGIVHRDVSPQNVLVGVDGVPRVIDFGVAKAIGRLDETRPGEVRGKFSYMAPEQMQARPVTRQVDVYAAGVVLWELLTGKRLFTGEDSRAVCAAVLLGAIPAPSTENAGVSPVVDAVVLRATAHDLGDRYLTAREMLLDLEGLAKASDDEVGAWVRRLAASQLAARQRLVQNAPVPMNERSVDELIDDVVRESSRTVDAIAPSAATGAAVVADTVRSPDPRPLRRRSWFVPALLLVAALLGLGLVLRLRPATSATTAGTSAPPREEPPPEPASSETPAAAATLQLVESPATPAMPTASSASSGAAAARATAARPARKPPRPATAPALDPRSYP